ncbi:MAG: polysaccharide biosynthesis protein [Desulfosarcina sp.]|nr:polysaccharide biosynthesis protein [Desulfosarcina sp.]MBC2764904.1 polysaccharide biosynthesis protein [Desulfosarcina sp.]
MNKVSINKNLFILLIADIILLSISYFLAYAIRFEAQLGTSEIVAIKKTIIPIVGCKLFIFYLFNLYRGIWRYTGIVDLINIIKAVFVSTIIILATILMLSRFEGFSRSVFVIDALITLILIAGIRLVIRLTFSSNPNPILFNDGNPNGYTRILIIGAGNSGEKVVREIQENPSMKYKAVGLLDDNKRKSGKSIHGVRVLGNIGELDAIVAKHNVNEVLIALSSATGEEMRRVVGICKKAGITYKTLPGLSELIDGKVSIKAMRDISYKDLLRRSPVRLENDKISQFLNDKTVLITGAGGSIGSELCRQICKFKPAMVLLFDASEANLYAIQMELKHIITYIKYRAILGRIQDEKLVNQVLKKYKPDVIFHAAAYKHVPLVERNPWEAVSSNIIGTQTLVTAAIYHKIDRFVLVSTDKAVRPTNVMGASKRVTEKIIQFQDKGLTKFIAVRFGNVIGSSGSVIPLFYNQIKKGGPVTVTHPEITRYFMTIEEAAQLILQAFTMGEGGEVFILNMGTPIKISDMARDLIKLAGKKPDSEVKIKYTGLRPGEKLYEELIIEGEGIVKTGHDKIMVLKKGHACKTSINEDLLDATCIDDKINDLLKLAGNHDAKGIKNKLKELVPEYTLSDDEAVV